MAARGYMIGAQAAIKIAPNEYGDVIIRQGDAVITINANNLETFVEIFVDIIGFAPPQPPDIDPLADDESAEKPPTYSAENSSHGSREPLTNAERQRRYRAQRRNGDRNGKRNGVTNGRNGADSPP